MSNKLYSASHNSVEPALTERNSKQMDIVGEIESLKGYIEGRLLTIVDATFNDPQQRKAMKDLFREAIWSQEYFTGNICNIAMDKPIDVVRGSN